MYSMKMVCEREDTAFICVASTARAAAARRTSPAAASTDVTASRCTPDTSGA
jgi:hypothetical protein